MFRTTKTLNIILTRKVYQNMTLFYFEAENSNIQIFAVHIFNNSRKKYSKFVFLHNKDELGLVNRLQRELSTRMFKYQMRKWLT